MVEIEINLAELRHKRGIPAAELARLAGISRQTVYAMEAGTFVPNTLVALKLARALEVSVEELFALPHAAPAPPLRTERVSQLPDGDRLEPGQPVQLCRVGKHLIATAPSPIAWYFPASDAVVGDGKGMTVEVFHGEWEE